MRPPRYEASAAVAPAIKRIGALVCGGALAMGLGACASTVSTSAFKGEAREVAQTISELQADAQAGDEQRICTRDLASSIVTRLNAHGGCKQSIKNQLTGLDSYELSVQRVQLGGSSARRTAHARVRSVYSGKTRTSTLLLLKEGGTWKISSLQ